MKKEFRVVIFPEPDAHCGIYEVLFDDDGRPLSCPSQPVTLRWRNGEMPSGKNFEQLKMALIQNWINAEEFGLPA